MAETALGSGQLFVGDPTQAEGAGMKLIKHHQGASFNPNFDSTYATSDNTGNLPIGGSVRNLITMAMLSTSLLELDDETLMAMLGGHLEKIESATGEVALAPKMTYQKQTPFTAVFIPDFQLDQGAAASLAIWIPAAHVLSNQNDLMSFSQPQSGDDARPYELQLSGVMPDDLSGIDRPWFKGDPAAFGLAWSVDTSLVPGYDPDAA